MLLWPLKPFWDVVVVNTFSQLIDGLWRNPLLNFVKPMPISLRVGVMPRVFVDVFFGRWPKRLESLLIWSTITQTVWHLQYRCSAAYPCGTPTRACCRWADGDLLAGTPAFHTIKKSESLARHLGGRTRCKLSCLDRVVNNLSSGSSTIWHASNL